MWPSTTYYSWIGHPVRYQLCWEAGHGKWSPESQSVRKVFASSNLAEIQRTIVALRDKIESYNVSDSPTSPPAQMLTDLNDLQKQYSEELIKLQTAEGVL